MSIMVCEHCGQYVDTDFAPTETVVIVGDDDKTREIEVCDSCAEELEMKEEIERG